MSTPFESMAALRAAITVLGPAEAAQVRERFVSNRIDPQLAVKAAEALELHEYSDGWGYNGYLWDFLGDKHVVSEEEIWQAVGVVPEIYAMSDLHSAERTRVPDAMALERGAVVRTDPTTLRRGLEYLPEDLYIFDARCAWAAALTHEWIEGERFCLWSGSRDAGAILTY